jgi:GNAT superfamily N-acetyltransferase
MTDIVVDVAERIRILSSGARLIRLTAADGLGWLREYQRILRVASTEFLKRSGLPGEPGRVMDELADLLTQGGAVWLVVDADYRLLGFSAARLRPAAWTAALIAEIPCCYLYPKKTPRGVFRALVRAMIEWAKEQRAESILFTTRRIEDAAWQRITGAKRIAAVYEYPLDRERDDG